MLLITHAEVITATTYLRDCTLRIENGRITGIDAGRDQEVRPDAEVLDASDLLVVPGFIDLQVNGAFG